MHIYENEHKSGGSKIDKKSIKLDSNFLDAYLNLGSLYFDKFDFEAALYYFRVCYSVTEDMYITGT